MSGFSAYALNHYLSRMRAFLTSWSSQTNNQFSRRFFNQSRGNFDPKFLTECFFEYFQMIHIFLWDLLHGFSLLLSFRFIKTRSKNKKIIPDRLSHRPFACDTFYWFFFSSETWITFSLWPRFSFSAVILTYFREIHCLMNKTTTRIGKTVYGWPSLTDQWCLFCSMTWKKKCSIRFSIYSYYNKKNPISCLMLTLSDMQLRDEKHPGIKTETQCNVWHDNRPWSAHAIVLSGWLPIITIIVSPSPPPPSPAPPFTTSNASFHASASLS